MNSFRIGIDASSSREGGGVRHLTEILKNLNPLNYPIQNIKVWGNKRTLSKLPDYPWLIKNHVPILEKSIFHRIFWWLFLFDNILEKECDVLLSTGGTFVGRFRPFVAMSRNMLVFDRVERSRYGWSINRLRLISLRFAQSATFQNAAGIIFISRYAKEVVSEQVDLAKKMTRVVYHGVSKEFNNRPKPQKLFSKDDVIKLLYVSTIDAYKHNWVVVEATHELRRRGYNVHLDVIGGNGFGPSMKKFERSVKRFDPLSQYIFYHGLLDHKNVVQYYKNADIFVYSSTCENMPNILIEAMSAGLPIVCSKSQPMPEFIGNAAEYYDPTSAIETANALVKLINDPEKRTQISELAYQMSKKYSWEKCSDETFSFLLNFVK
jgi:glycosyltransferase involved in cell wall biosynthesis